MVVFLLSVLVMAGTPFEDVQNRFTVTLPTHWVFAPQPGDTGGAFFQRTQQGVLANATVRVVRLNGTIDLDTFAVRIGEATDHEPGYRLLINEPTRVVGAPALNRRFVVSINGDAKWTKMVEQRIVVVGNFGYVLHVETLADAFPLFQEDFTKFFDSFKPGTGEAPPLVKGPKGRRSSPRQIAGRWEGAGHALELSPGGTAILDRVSGTYRLDNGSLRLKLGDTNLIYEYELSGDTLRLSGGNFSGGQNFHRVVANPASPAPTTPLTAP